MNHKLQFRPNWEMFSMFIFMILQFLQPSSQETNKMKNQLTGMVLFGYQKGTYLSICRTFTYMTLSLIFGV